MFVTWTISRGCMKIININESSNFSPALLLLKILRMSCGTNNPSFNECSIESVNYIYRLMQQRAKMFQIQNDSAKNNHARTPSNTTTLAVNN